MPSVTEVAWAAGFFDGEGNTHWQAAKPNGDGGSWGGCIRVRVSQTERTTLDRFRDAVGEGKVYGPYRKATPLKPRLSPQWEWQANGDAALRVLTLIWPHLSNPKKAQAMAVLHEKAAA